LGLKDQGREMITTDNIFSFILFLKEKIGFDEVYKAEWITAY